MAQQNKKTEPNSEYTPPEVTYACLHAPIFLPGLGQFGATLVVGSGSTVSRITKMYLNEYTLTVMIGTNHVEIPLMNVTHMKMAV